MKLVYLCALLTSCVYSQSQGMYPDIEDTARNTFAYHQ